MTHPRSKNLSEAPTVLLPPTATKAAKRHEIRISLPVDIDAVLKQMSDRDLLEVVVRCICLYGGSVAAIRAVVNSDEWDDVPAKGKL